MKTFIILFLIVSSQLAAADNSPSGSQPNGAITVSCENLTSYPRVNVVIYQNAGQATGSGTVTSSDHGPFANISCADIRTEINGGGEAICAGVYADDFTMKNGAPDKTFDTVVTVKVSKVLGKLTVAFNLPQAWDGKQATATCQLLSQ